MCCNGVIWLSEVCYNVSIADSVYYKKFCIADMLQFNIVLKSPPTVNTHVFVVSSNPSWYLYLILPTDIENHMLCVRIFATKTL